jgi:hypothetical protein
MTCLLGDGFLDTGVYICIRSRSQSPPLYARDARAPRAREYAWCAGAKLLVVYPNAHKRRISYVWLPWGGPGVPRAKPGSARVRAKLLLRPLRSMISLKAAGWVTSADHGVPRKRMSCTQNVLAQERDRNAEYFKTRGRTDILTSQAIPSRVPKQRNVLRSRWRGP